ncbi:MAG: tyrosine-type recombinase/integrase [Planctomycetota bacterium]
MAGVCKRPEKSGRYRGWFMRADGRQKSFVGTASRQETLSIAEGLEHEERLVRLGYKQPGKSADKHKTDPIGEKIEAYLEWGRHMGGRGGRPWARGHARMRETHLRFWQKRLGLQTLADLDGVLPHVEKALAELQEGGASGKTLTHYANAVKAFCGWLVERGFLCENPLSNLTAYDTTPVSAQRRAMTVDEIERLLAVVPDHRALLYELALCSGLRAGELRALSVENLDTRLCGVHLDASWTKSRRGGFQPLPKGLVERLSAFAESGRAAELYGQSYSRRDAGGKGLPERPLLYVPTHTARDMDKDVAAAEIQKQTVQGRIDFHSLRTSYITLVSEAGASAKEVQHLARHASVDMSFNIYARTREDRLSQVAEAVGKRVNPGPEYADSMQRQAAGAEGLDVNAIDSMGLGLAESRKASDSIPAASTIFPSTPRRASSQGRRAAKAARSSLMSASR